jgi:hypothetical protein
VTHVLHLLKGDDVELLLNVLAQQRAAGDDVTLVRLPGASAVTLPAGVAVLQVPDDLSYEALLERIFQADQVITW